MARTIEYLAFGIKWFSITANALFCLALATAGIYGLAVAVVSTARYLIGAMQ